MLQSRGRGGGAYQLRDGGGTPRPEGAAAVSPTRERAERRGCERCRGVRWEMESRPSHKPNPQQGRLPPHPGLRVLFFLSHKASRMDRCAFFFRYQQKTRGIMSVPTKTGASLRCSENSTSYPSPRLDDAIPPVSLKRMGASKPQHFIYPHRVGKRKSPLIAQAGTCDLSLL